MKLSEAMRLGSMLGPQGFGFVGDREGDGTLCANQAALAALGLSNVREVPFYLTRAQCPVCTISNVVAYIIAVHLNDKHQWTREQIADWVASVEPQEGPDDSVAEPLIEGAQMEVTR